MIPLPLRDDNPTSRTPIVTYALIAANILCWFYQLSYGLFESTFDFGAIPQFLLHHVNEGVVHVPGHRFIEVHQPPWPTSLFTSMFMHGSWMHIIGNMWFLWIFGDNVEDSMGRVKYLFFYLLCGVIAATAQILVSADSSFPMVGASGAISGVLGAYLLLYPHARVKCLWILIIFIQFIWIPAWLLLGIWFISQFFVPMGAGIAWMAHVGGFVAGLALIKLFAHRRTPPPPPPRVVWSN